ncbi:galactose mutarotase [Maribacter hydrothermalis]|uniref:Aldose 1-epimerase n=2 Tax=Maribacter hydrothermalis TaxID=1836467 RepID=A0A1B7Z196_9FLAO|nr:galactose mutarotase [Maribacter hydrothermalis]OBR36485.1 galactose mutarotase [Maribacter hydrothermalis]
MLKLVSRNSISIVFLVILIGISSCKNNKANKSTLVTQTNIQPVSITKNSYGTTTNSENVDKFILSNKGGVEVEIITYGGRITSLKTVDNKGNLENVVLGFEDLEQYEKPNPYFGALVGRYGNRIANGKFILNNTEYTLAKNNGENSLHGGLKGFDKVVWKVEDVKDGDKGVLKLSYVSKDMEEGFPGSLTTFVTYTLNADNSLDVLYEATTDKTTIVNLTQHTYFNLSGNFSESIVDHEVEIYADKFVPVDDDLIPLGNLASVDGTPFDFRTSKLVSRDINSKNEQIVIGGGYDHCWVLNNPEVGYRSVAKVYHSKSGRAMEVLTNEPGVQFYTGNFLDGTLPSPNGGTFDKRSGFCLETQHYPDTPNQPNFPTVTLVPGETYSSKTTFKFSTK